MAKYTVQLSRTYEVEVEADDVEAANDAAVNAVLNEDDDVSVGQLTVDHTEENE